MFATCPDLVRYFSLLGGCVLSFMKTGVNGKQILVMYGPENRYLTWTVDTHAGKKRSPRPFRYDLNSRS